MANVLITGGSGFLGSHLISHLHSEGKSVSVLGRTITNNISSFLWNIEKQTMDESAISGKDTIIHLAGAGIANKRWTSSYKKEIIESRVKSAGLLFEKIKKIPNTIKTFISASAIGYYGDAGDVWVEEDFHAPEDFMGKTCIEWEKSARQFESLGIRVIIFRIGLVLSKDGGVLPALVLPVKFFAGAPLGNGKQYMSWIHIIDLCRLFSFAIDNRKINGTYNAVAPSPVTNKTFIKNLGGALHRPVWPFNIPAAIMKLILGEKAAIVLNGQRVSNKKIRMAGFNFQYTDFNKTLKELV